MSKKIAGALVAIVVAFVAFVATRPAEFSVARSRVTKAPPAVVHGFVNDFHRWPEWSPWEKLDPAMKREISGAAAGTGAVYSWSGNDQVGAGRMTITDSVPPRSVTIRLEFLKPWTATNTTVFAMEPDGAGTRVTWTMNGRNDFMAKAASVFMDMDAMVGADFERGLANLDAVSAAAVAESPRPPS